MLIIFQTMLEKSLIWQKSSATRLSKFKFLNLRGHVEIILICGLKALAYLFHFGNGGNMF